MASFTLSELLTATGGVLYAPPDFACDGVTDVSIDTRTLKAGALYVPIRGDVFDGHRFIADAFAKGAALTLSETPCDAPHIRVADCVRAYQDIARLHRMRFSIPVVCITGSVGKTTTKDLVTAVLRQSYRTHSTRGNLNNQTGVPTTVLQLDASDQASVMELGTNHFGEIDAIARVARPTVCLFTNIGEAHIEFFGSREGIFRGKTEMLAHLVPGGSVIVNGDDDLLCTLSPAITYGLREGVDVRGTNLCEHGLAGVSFCAEVQGRSLPIRLAVSGRHMVSNALAAIAVGVLLGVPDEKIQAALASFSPTAGRTDITQTSRFTLIDGTYNCNPTSMEAALHVLQNAAGRRVCIFGDMLELGAQSPAYHARIGTLAKACGVDLLLCVGPLAAHATDVAAHRFPDLDALHAALPALLLDGDTILVKASQGMHLSRTVAFIKAM